MYVDCTFDVVTFWVIVSIDLAANIVFRDSADGVGADISGGVRP